MATVVEHAAPPLLAGDKLSREEFLRRWEMHPEIKKAELIGGMVYMSSPVSIEHGYADADVATWLGHYRVATPGTIGGQKTTAFLVENTPQPDQFLRILRECGGGSWEEDNYLAGVPEFLAEICRSSVSYDLVVKHDLYESAGVPEYLAVLLFEQEIRWHILVNGKYQLLPPDPDGLWRSRVFPGLWLDGKALLARNLAQVLGRLQDGLNSQEHKEFVAALQRKGGGTPRA